MSDKIPGWSPGDPIRVLPYAAPKVGKTFGAGTFPRPCFMDFDRGIATLFSPDFFRAYGKKDILYREFYDRSFQGPIVKAHNGYDDACRFFDEMMSPAKVGLFDTWVVDSGTTLSEDAQNKAVILLGAKEYGFMSKTHEQAMKYNLLVPKIQDYGAERSLVEQFVAMVLSTSKNVVFICHEYEQTDESGNTIAVMPLLTGKSRQAIPLSFDEVYWIRTRRKGLAWERVCTVQPDGIHLVGSRNGQSDGVLWDFNSVRQGLVKAYEERVKLFSTAPTAGDKASAAPAVKTPASAQSGQGRQ